MPESFNFNQQVCAARKLQIDNLRTFFELHHGYEAKGRKSAASAEGTTEKTGKITGTVFEGSSGGEFFYILIDGERFPFDQVIILHEGKEISVGI